MLVRIRIIALSLFLVCMVWVLFGQVLASMPEKSEKPQAHLLQQARIVLLGELHDNPHHHRKQAEFIHSLGSTAKRPAIVYEMLPFSLQSILDDYKGDAETFGETVGWNALGWPDYNHYDYDKTVEAALEIKAKLIAGGLDRDDVMSVTREGFKGLPDHLEQRFSSLLPKLAISPPELLKEQFEVHCGKIKRENLDGMVKAQWARDMALSNAVLMAIENHHADKVIVIAGRGHTRNNYGIPFFIKSIAPEYSIISVALGELEEAPLANTLASLYPHDIYIETSGMNDRTDPCLYFNSSSISK